MTTTSDKPTVDLNLDTLAKEAHEQPYTVVLGGQPYTLKHAGLIDAFDLFDAMGKGEPHATIGVLTLAMGPDAFAKMRKAKPSFGQMQAVVSGYFTHSGMTGN